MTETEELDALLVHSIGDLEAAMTRVNTTIDPELWKQVSSRLNADAPALGWTVVMDEEHVDWLAPTDWITTVEDDPDSSFWFRFVSLPGPSEADDSGDWTDLAAFVGGSAHGNHMGLLLQQDVLKPAKWKKHLRTQGELLDELREGGFSTNLEQGAVAHEVRISPEALSQAFGSEDFDAALEPLGTALKAAAALRPIFDRLIAIVPTPA